MESERMEPSELDQNGFRLEQSPSLERLADFEAASWPEGERASREDLQRRLESFPEGIFMLSDDGVDVAQTTVSPKEVGDPNNISSFERMRDLEVDRTSKTLWMTNVSRRMGSAFRGRGYGEAILTGAFAWSRDQGYESLIAGVTCDGYHAAREAGTVKSIEEYMDKGMNPALNAFQKAAKQVGASLTYEQPIPDYWPEDASSEGYGVMVSVDFNPEERAEQ